MIKTIQEVGVEEEIAQIEAQDVEVMEEMDKGMLV